MSAENKTVSEQVNQQNYAGLLGVWKFTSYVRKDIETGEVRNVFGDSPRGYLIYTREGRMMVQVIPQHRQLITKQADRIEHHEKMVSYSGLFSVSGNKVIHHVDVAWNEAWVGENQEREFSIDGNQLIITTNPTVYNIQEGAQISTLKLEKC